MLMFFLPEVPPIYLVTSKDLPYLIRNKNFDFYIAQILYSSWKAETNQLTTIKMFPNFPSMKKMT